MCVVKIKYKLAKKKNHFMKMEKRVSLAKVLYKAKKKKPRTWQFTIKKIQKYSKSEEC